MASMIAKNIALYRLQNGWSQEDLAEKLDVSRQSISKWENGLTEPGIDKLLKMADLFVISTDKLLSHYNPADDSLLSSYISADFSICHVTGYNISTLLDEMLLESGWVGILYDYFSGIALYESVYNFCTKPTEDHSSLKNLILSMDDPHLNPSRLCITTKESPAKMADFCSWLIENSSNLNIASILIIYEQNEDYDYHSIPACINNLNFNDNEEWDFVKKALLDQQYAGPFPPPAFICKLTQSKRAFLSHAQDFLLRERKLLVYLCGPPNPPGPIGPPGPPNPPWPKGPPKPPIGGGPPIGPWK